MVVSLPTRVKTLLYQVSKLQNVTSGKTITRVLLLAVFLVATGVTANAYVSNSVAVGDQVTPGDDIGPPEDLTVVATQWGRGEKSHLTAFDEDGTVVYRQSEFDGYYDVDPSPLGKYTVLFTAAKELREPCTCTRNEVRRVNLSTGESTTLLTRKMPGHFNNEWHDVDRLNDTHMIVADMDNNRVYTVDTRTGTVTWGWSAQEWFDTTEGGSAYFGTGYPDDWTHLNDVEVLDDGRIMVSIRNFDQVVFLNRSGVVDDWTLGADDEHSTLYEQHNPDYLPEENGGPTVLVADSHNNRIVEYRRQTDGEWNRTWTWRDTTLNWPRDADRLPSGNTLITDTNGDRVVEVNPDGEVVWSVEAEGPYEAERLGTGPESTGGPAANDSYTSVTSPGSGEGLNPTRVALQIKNALPSFFVNALLFVIPAWMNGTSLFASIVAVLALLSLAVVEARRSEIPVNVELSIEYERED